MKIKRTRQKSLAAFVLTAVILFGGVPLKAQDIITSSDIAGGSSVFVFRVSRKAPQGKSAFRSSSAAARSSSRRKASRQKVVRQSTAVARARQKARPTKRIDPQTFARLSPTFKTISKEEGSLIFAGAGEYHLERDDLAQAIEVLKEAVTLDPANKFASQGLSDAYTRRGNELLEAEDLPKARFFFEEAVRLDEQNSTAYAGLGEVFAAQDEKPQAIESYRKALEINRELTELHAPLGILYYQQGEIAKAEDNLTKALKINPDDAETQYFLGLIRYKQTRYDDAETALRYSIRLDPTNAEAFYYLGEVYDKLDRQPEAIAAYQKAVELDPKFVEAWFDLGAALYNSERFEEAVTAYKSVIRNKTDYFQAYANLGDVYRQMNRLGEAAGQYQIATARIKDDAELLSSYGYVLGRQGKWNAAIDILEKSVAASPDVTDYTNLGWAYYNAAQEDKSKLREPEARGKLENGREALQKGLQLNPKFVPAMLNLGVINNELGNYQTAVEVLKKAIDESESRSVKVLADNEIGIAYFGLKNLEKASDHFQRAVKLDENFVPAIYSLGETEYRRGNKKEAQKALDRLQKLGATYYYQRLRAILLGAVLR